MRIGDALRIARANIPVRRPHWNGRPECLISPDSMIINGDGAAIPDLESVGTGAGDCCLTYDDLNAHDWEICGSATFADLYGLLLMGFPLCRADWRGYSHILLSRDGCHFEFRRVFLRGKFSLKIDLAAKEPAGLGLSDFAAHDWTVWEPHMLPLDTEISNAVYELDTEDDDHWTADGRPDVEAVQKILGIDAPTRDRIDAAASCWTRDFARFVRSQGGDK